MKIVISFIIVIIIFFHPERIDGQNMIGKFDLYQKADSVVLVYEVAYDKETSSEFDDIYNYPSFRKSCNLNETSIS